MLTVKRKTDVFLFLFFLDSLNVTERLSSSLILLTISKNGKQSTPTFLKGLLLPYMVSWGRFWIQMTPNMRSMALTNRFSFVFTHILKFMRTIDFRTFSTQGLINEATLMISWLTFNLCDTIALTYLNPPRHTFTHLFTSTLIHTSIQKPFTLTQKSIHSPLNRSHMLTC